jgi:hypothetical protein
VPAIPSSILELLWFQFAVLLPERHDSHLLGLVASAAAMGLGGMPLRICARQRQSNAQHRA